MKTKANESATVLASLVSIRVADFRICGERRIRIIALNAAVSPNSEGFPISKRSAMGTPRSRGRTFEMK